MNLLEQEPQPELSYTPGRAIQLTQGQITVVDADDYDRLCQWKWYAWWSPCTQSFYARSNVPRSDGKQNTLLMHRVIVEATSGRQVDHHNHDTLDNRRLNLRHVTQLQNLQNKRTYKNNTSGYRGVVWNKKERQWRAQITLRINLKRMNHIIGRYSNAAEASAAYEKFARTLRGEFGHPSSADHETQAFQI